MSSVPSVSFSPVACVRGMLHIDEYSEKEVTACWYCRDELRAIKKEAKATILEMAAGNFVDSEFACSRGLETLTAAGSARKRLVREEAWDAVLDEQELQAQEKVCNPDMIAQLYFERTRQAQAMAGLIGKADERWVRQQENLPLNKKKSTDQQQLDRGVVLFKEGGYQRRTVSSPAA